MEQLAIKFPEWTRVAEVDLVYQTTAKDSERPKISCIEGSYNLFEELWNENTMEKHEEFKVVY